MGSVTVPSAAPSLYVRFAESIEGIRYILLAVSIFAAVILGESGLVVTIEDILDSLIIASLGEGPDRHHRRRVIHLRVKKSEDYEIGC